MKVDQRAALVAAGLSLAALVTACGEQPARPIVDPHTQAVEARFASIKDPYDRVEAEIVAKEGRAAVDVLEAMTGAQQKDPRWRPLHNRAVEVAKYDAPDGQVPGSGGGPNASLAAQSPEDNFFKSQVVAKAKMADVLRDSDSAKYRDVVAYPFVTDDGTTLYIFCGQVNAKNGFGGYSGYQRFIATPEGGAVESGAGDFATGWNQHCNGAARPVVAF